MLWHAQSRPTIQKLDKNMPVVVPVASCEQHGRHLPLFVDTIQVTSIAERVEKEMADQILLTPTLWLGCSHHHMDYPGTISVAPSLFSQIIKSIAQSVLRAGFKRIVFLNGHGGNEIPGSQALTELVNEDDDADGACLAFSSWWMVAKEGLAAEKHGMSSPQVSHACEYETSLMLFLRPDLVVMDEIVQNDPILETPWYHSEYGGRVHVFHRFSRLTAPGNMGKPKEASAEKGESLFRAVIADVKSFLTDFATWPKFERIGPK
jgi:creatinine amidohydrolase